MSGITKERTKKKFKVIDVPGRGPCAFEKRESDEDDSSDWEECSNLSQDEGHEEDVTVGKVASCTSVKADGKFSSVQDKRVTGGGVSLPKMWQEFQNHETEPDFKNVTTDKIEKIFENMELQTGVNLNTLRNAVQDNANIRELFFAQNIYLNLWKKQTEEKFEEIKTEMERQEEVIVELSEQTFDIPQKVPDVGERSFLRFGFERVKSLDVHPTSPWLLLGLFNGKVAIFNFETSTPEKIFQLSEKPVRCAKFVVRKNWIVSGSDDKLVYVIDYASKTTHKFEAHSDSLRSIAIHPIKPYVLTASDDKTVKLWNWDKNWSLKRTFSGHTHYVMQVAINPKNDGTFASASLDGNVKLWRFDSEAPILTLKGHEKGVNCIAYFQEGEKSYLLSGADDALIKVWDYQNGNCIETLEGHTGNVTAIHIHPDLPLIFSGSEDCTLRIWNAKTYGVTETVQVKEGRIWCLQKLTQTYAIAAGHDKGISVFEIPEVAYFDLNRVRQLGHVMVKHGSGGQIDLVSEAMAFEKQHLPREERSQAFLTHLLRKVVPKEDIPKYAATKEKDEFVLHFKRLPRELNLPIKKVFCAAHGIRLDDSGVLEELPHQAIVKLYTPLGLLYNEMVDRMLRDWKDKDEPENEGATNDAKSDAKPAAKPDAKPAAKPDAKPAAKPDAKPAAKPAAKAAAKEEEPEDDDPLAVYRRKALAETNKYRKRHGAEPLVQDKRIDAYAQEWAEHLANSNAFYHRQPNKYGENLAGEYPHTKSAVSLWYDEVDNYGYGYGGFSMGTGHFTQLVWKSSKRVGFGVAKNPYSGMTIVVANYDPPGNCLGQFYENVSPPQ